MRITNFLSRENEETQSVDLHISDHWVLGGMVLTATLVMIVVLAMGDNIAEIEHWQNLALLIFLLTAAAIYLYTWKPQLGIICGISSYMIYIFVGLFWLNLFSSFAFLTIPVLLGAILRSLKMSLAFAALESLGLLGLFISGAVPVNEVFLALAFIWLTFLLFAAVYQPIYQATNWYRMNCKAMQQELDEVRAERQERSQMIEELDLANRQLTTLFNKISLFRQIAEDSEKEKALFVAKVSHEFRTPLSMILGLSSLMMNDQHIYGGNLPPDLVEDITIINRNCTHMAKLVNDVLELTRSEAGQLALTFDWADIQLDIEEVVAETSPLIEKKKLNLIVDVPADLPRVYCDHLRIRQVILNLLGNATHYTEKGDIRVLGHYDAQAVAFDIADSGPGIPASDLDLIFEPFERGHNYPSGEAGGSGLGLSISRQLIELHGGQIWVKSELGKGSTFSFKIPFSPQPSPRANAARWISQDKIWESRKMRLTVDPTPTERKVLVYDPEEELNKLFQFHREVDFEYASELEVVIQKSKYQSYAVVLVAGQTPEKTLQFVDSCRSRLLDTPVVGCAYPSSVQKLKDAGIAAYVTKPIIFEEFERKIQMIQGAKKRILIVDDDSDLCKLLVRMLFKMDEECQVFTVSSGEEALQVIPEIKPDLIVLDIVMGGMDGWEMLKEKNRSSELRQIPVIILSGQDVQAEQMTTPVLVSGYGEGLNMEKLLQCALSFSEVMLRG